MDPFILESIENTLGELIWIPPYQFICSMSLELGDLSTEKDRLLFLDDIWKARKEIYRNGRMSVDVLIDAERSNQNVIYFYVGSNN